MTIVIGAGLAGALAGALDPTVTVFESGGGESTHKAVLRFREPKIGRALGIPFKEVRVYKSIFMNGRHYSTVNPAAMNLYSQKVTGGGISGRSITDLATVTRYVAPDDLHEHMKAMMGSRLHVNARVADITRDALTINGEHMRRSGAIISTAPLKHIISLLDPAIHLEAEFKFAPISVTRWTIPHCDVHQTVYFPEPGLGMYRATLTGGNLIMESMKENTPDDYSTMIEALGLLRMKIDYVGVQTQRFGKIVAIDATLRKHTLLKMTMDYGLYSLGRFACWRNILLDDVYEDLFKIRTMIGLTNYDLIRSVTK